MNHYLVTGAAGFIGGRVAELLLANGHTVTGLDNMENAAEFRLKQWRLDRLTSYPDFHFHRIDIAHAEALAPLGALHFDAVINLAAKAGVRQSTEDPSRYIHTNVTGTLNLLDFCRNNRIEKFLLASTSSLYGGNNPIPYREHANTDRPLSPYAATKKSAEALCYCYHHLYGIDVTIFRYFTVYGPAGRPDMSVLRFVQRIIEERPVVIYGDGSQSRDYTYVDDIARGTIAGLAPVGFDVFNLGSNYPVRVIDLVRTIERLTGRVANIEFRAAHLSDVPATWADVEKARQVLDWQPQFSYEQGLGAVVDWYRSNRDWAQFICTDSN